MAQGVELPNSSNNQITAQIEIFSQRNTTFILQEFIHRFSSLKKPLKMKGNPLRAVFSLDFFKHDYNRVSDNVLKIKNTCPDNRIFPDAELLQSLSLSYTNLT